MTAWALASTIPTADPRVRVGQWGAGNWRTVVQDDPQAEWSETGPPYPTRKAAEAAVPDRARPGRHRMTSELGWTRVPDLDIPAWDLDEDSSYYIEKWGLGSFAVYHNAERVPDSSTTYGSLEAAKISAEIAYRSDPDGAALDPSTTDGLEG